MEYELLAVGKSDGLVGYVIRKVGLLKLESINIFGVREEDEAIEMLMDLNHKAKLRQFWPSPFDTSVEKLMADPDFLPVEYDLVEVPDVENSDIVYDTKPGAKILDSNGEVTGFAPDEVKYDEQGKPIINWMASNIVYKKEKQPKRTQGRSRLDAAMEYVANERMAANA